MSLPGFVLIVGSDADDVAMGELEAQSAARPEPDLRRDLVPNGQGGAQRARRAFGVELLLAPRRRRIRELGVDPEAPRLVACSLMILRKLESERVVDPDLRYPQALTRDDPGFSVTSPTCSLVQR
jgi:hypothetical protein